MRCTRCKSKLSDNDIEIIDKNNTLYKCPKCGKEKAKTVRMRREHGR